MTDAFDSESLERDIAAKLTVSVLDGEGSVTAARQVLELVDRIRRRQVATEHRQRMADLKSRPTELARYLGYLGESVRAVESHLGHDLEDHERSAFEEGKAERQLELRAVELDQAIRGQMKPAPWMRS